MAQTDQLPGHIYFTAVGMCLKYKSAVDSYALQQDNEAEISIEQIIVEFDADGDKNISQEEFQTLYQEKLGNQQEDAEQGVSGLFAKLDADRNKELDSEEMNSDAAFRKQLSEPAKID